MAQAAAQAAKDALLDFLNDWNIQEPVDALEYKQLEAAVWNEIRSHRQLHPVWDETDDEEGVDAPPQHCRSQEALNIIEGRFNGYSKQIRKNTVGVHYNDIHNAKHGYPKRDLRRELWERLKPGVFCNGACDDRCPDSVVFDGKSVEEFGLKIALNKFEFDHTYDQKYIKISYEAAFERAVRRGAPEAADCEEITQWNMTYVKSNAVRFSMVLNTPLRRAIAIILRRFINLPLLLEDLYGTRIQFRCPQCHTQGAKDQTHIAYSETRYYLTPQQ